MFEHTGFHFWVRWVLASAMGSAIGAGIALSGPVTSILDLDARVGDPHGWKNYALSAMLGIIYGTSLSLLQWFVARRQSHRFGYWIPANVVGWALTTTFTYAAFATWLTVREQTEFREPELIPTVIAVLAFGGALIAFLQWLALRLPSRGVGWWSFIGSGSIVIALSAGWTIAQTGGLSLSKALGFGVGTPGTWTVVTSLGGFVSGAVIGVAQGVSYQFLSKYSLQKKDALTRSLRFYLRTAIERATNRPLFWSSMVVGFLLLITSLFILDRSLDSSRHELNTIFLDSIKSEDWETIALFLNYDRDLNIQDEEGRTALILAIERGKTEIISALLDNGADVNIKEACTELTPLILATRKGRDDLVRLFLGRGADVDAKDSEGMTALMWAARIGDIDSIRALLNAGADVNAVDRRYWTALMWASVNGHTDSARTLLEKGSDMYAKSFCRRTAATYAVLRGHQETFQLLEDAGFNKKDLLEDGLCPPDVRMPTIELDDHRDNEKLWKMHDSLTKKLFGCRK